MATHSSIFFFSTPVFLPGKFHGQRSLRAAVCGVAKSQTQLSTHTLSYADEKTEVQREEGTFTYRLIQHILMLIYHFPSKLGLRSSDVNSEKLHRLPYTPISLCLKNFKLQ